jgi:hypothetical protein
MPLMLVAAENATGAAADREQAEDLRHHRPIGALPPEERILEVARGRMARMSCSSISPARN